MFCFSLFFCNNIISTKDDVYSDVLDFNLLACDNCRNTISTGFLNSLRVSCCKVAYHHCLKQSGMNFTHYHMDCWSCCFPGNPCLYSCRFGEVSFMYAQSMHGDMLKLPRCYHQTCIFLTFSVSQAKTEKKL